MAYRAAGEAKGNDERARALTGTSREISDAILLILGPDKARTVARALDERLRNLRRKCPCCGGTGFYMAVNLMSIRLRC